MSNLNGKIALVSGASKGIGASIAKHLAAAGATVVVNYATSKSGGDKVVADIEAAGGKRLAIQGDFSKQTDITRVFNEVKTRHGKLDILVNNAGVYGFAPLEAITAEEFHRTFDLNVLGLLLATQAGVALMPPTGGSVINIGSVVGSMPQAAGTVYAATKGAVDTISIALSKELGPRNIRVNSLNPGAVLTEGAQEIFKGDFRTMVEKITPLGRIGQPEDIGKVAVFLASDDSYWITGQRINAGGGATM